MAGVYRLSALAGPESIASAKSFETDRECKMKDGGIVTVLLAISGVALAATLVVNGTNTAKIVGSAGTAYSNAIGAAEKG
jgi:hypothetical protein